MIRNIYTQIDFLSSFKVVFYDWETRGSSNSYILFDKRNLPPFPEQDQNRDNNGNNNNKRENDNHND